VRQISEEGGPSKGKQNALAGKSFGQLENERVIPGGVPSSSGKYAKERQLSLKKEDEGSLHQARKQK